MTGPFRMGMISYLFYKSLKWLESVFNSHAVGMAVA